MKTYRQKGKDLTLDAGGEIPRDEIVSFLAGRGARNVTYRELEATNISEVLGKLVQDSSEKGLIQFNSLDVTDLYHNNSGDFDSLINYHLVGGSHE